MPPTFTSAQAAAFAEHGVVRLGRVLTPDRLTALRQRIDDIMLGKIRYDGMMMQLDSTTGRYEGKPEQTVGFKGATLDYRKIEQLEKDPLFLAWMHDDPVRSIAASLVGPEVAIFRSMFMNKPAGRGTVLPWHQDGGTGWRLQGGHPQVTIWLALDPATRANGCVEVVRGSHRLGLLSERGHAITGAQVAEHCPPARVEHIEMEPGEAFLMHNWVLHGSGVNASGIPRRAFSLCLMDAAVASTDPGHPGYPRLYAGGRPC